MFSSPLIQDNHDYYREYATFFASTGRLILSRLVLTNRSDFSLSDVHVELSVRCPTDEVVALYRRDDVPEEPSESTFYLANIHDSRRKMTVDDQGAIPVVHIVLGTVRPGQTLRAEEDLAIVPSSPGVYSIQAQIFANELPAPISVEHQFEVTGDVVDVTEAQFFEKLMND